MASVRILTCFIIFLAQALIADEIKPDATLMIPMRDGTELPSDIYLPSTGATKLPCALIRSPAGRQANSAKVYLSLVKQGYAVVVQDTRSVLDKQGKTLPYYSDGWGHQQDGYDTVVWLANSPYTNGNIGTAGFSALGITQLMMAPTAPPGLKCQYIGVAAPSLYHHAIFPGGQLLKNQVEGWLGLYAKDPTVRNFVCGQAIYSEFWNQFDTTLVSERIKVPALHYGGWFDTFLQGTLDAFTSRHEHGGEGAKGQQKLLIGPWTHLYPASTKLGDFEVPKAGLTPPVDMSVLRYFDYYLKGIRNGTETIPAVTYYVMGPFDGSPSSGNVWRTADTWPIPSTATAFYLMPDQKITERLASAQNGEISFEYDPSNPVPTMGGRNLFLESGPKDQRPLEQRKDVITFTSEPLQEDIEITGRILANLYVASDHKNCDIVVRFSDVYPDGRSLLISDGLFHICPAAEKSDDAAASAQPKEEASQKPKDIVVDLWSTSIVLAKGHRIRFSISGSNYPKFEKIDQLNPLAEVIRNKLFVGEANPSHIILPIVRRGDTWLNKPKQI